MAVEKKQAYSNLLLHQTIEKYKIDAKDRGSVNRINIRTLQYKMTLDYYLEPFIRGKLDVWVLHCYDFPLSNALFNDRIP